VYTVGTGNREEIHQLGFDSSLEFHEYTIDWSPERILWLIDGAQVRKYEREGGAYPTKPMFLYASVWNAGYIDNGNWAGCYVGCDEPYLCTYKDVQIPHV
jgi:beta-glucanase (GH16 family)